MDVARADAEGRAGRARAAARAAAVSLLAVAVAGCGGRALRADGSSVAGAGGIGIAGQAGAGGGAPGGVGGDGAGGDGGGSMDALDALDALTLDAVATDAAFAMDFAARASAALAAGAPSWTCATALPTVPVADAAAAREVIHAFVARVVGVPLTDVALQQVPCNTPMWNTCAATFAHDCAKSGGAIYQTVMPLAEELNATAASVEETIWVPTNMTGDVAMSGISDGLLVGMIVFNGTYPCR